ncbi:hypothetical protein Tsubulata_000378, partial [Turnera subulata]
RQEPVSGPTKRMAVMSESTKLHLAMIFFSLAYAGLHVIVRAALNMGVSKFVFPVYRNIIALLLIAPIAYLVENLEQVRLKRKDGVAKVLGLAFGIQMWVIQKGGPVFMSSYLPLQTVLVAVMSSIALGEKFYLGGIIGAVLIIVGLYLVLWGKNEERKLDAADVACSPTEDDESRSPRHSCLAKPSIPGSGNLQVPNFRRRQNRNLVQESGPTKRMALMSESKKLHIAMIIFSLAIAGNHVIVRAALNMGVSKFVFLVYRNIISLFLLAPIAYFVEKKHRPKLTFSILILLFLCGFIGITLNQVLFQVALENTSPAFLSAAANVVPAVTFVLAVLFRQGLVVSGLAYGIQVWVIEKGGPVFLSGYLPLQTMLVAVMASVALGEEFYLGGIIGALLIIVGLYLVIWGKSKEKLEAAKVMVSSPPEDNESGFPGHSCQAQPSLPDSSN